MRVIALERELEHPDPVGAELLAREAHRVWELEQADVLREACFRADSDLAVLFLEVSDVDEAGRILETLPLVAAGAIAFDLIPLRPYPGLARLFADRIDP